MSNVGRCLIILLLAGCTSAAADLSRVPTSKRVGTSGEIRGAPCVQMHGDAIAKRLGITDIHKLPADLVFVCKPAQQNSAGQHEKNNADSGDASQAH